MSIPKSSSFAGVSSGQVIDFEIAEVRTLPMQGEPHLWVKGVMPTTGFDVRLTPRVYHNRPEYWEIEVTVTQLPYRANERDETNRSLMFERSVPLSGTIGVRGITVVGASQTMRIEISGESL